MHIGYIHTSVHRAPFGGGWVRLSRYILYGLLKKKIVEAALNCSPYIIQMLWDVALTCLTFPRRSHRRIRTYLIRYNGFRDWLVLEAQQVIQSGNLITLEVEQRWSEK